MSAPSIPGPARESAWQLPETPRVLPFVVFLLVGAIPASWFTGAQFWAYLAKTLAAGALLWHFRPRLHEMRWAFSVPAVVIGVVIAVLWIGLEGRIPSLEELWAGAQRMFTGKAGDPPKASEPWNPVAYFAGQPALGWFFVAVRVLGRSLVVPAMEEVFYRSFVYRYIINPKFLDVSLTARHWGAFAATSAMFGLVHPGQWVQGILCGAAYQWLVLRRGRLGEAMLAHAVTNLLISGYAIGTGRWEFT